MRVAFVTCMLASAFALVAACQQPPLPPHVDIVYVDAGDAGGEWPSENQARVPICVSACKRLATLACEEALTPDGGLTCYALCEKAELSGRFSLNPDCVAHASDRVALKVCGSVRCGSR